MFKMEKRLRRCRHRSLAKFLPELGERAPTAALSAHGDWAHHGANHYYKPYDQALRRLTANRRGGRLLRKDTLSPLTSTARCTSVNHRMWDITSGFTEWKINSCYPDVQWQKLRLLPQSRGQPLRHQASLRAAARADGSDRFAVASQLRARAAVRSGGERAGLDLEAGRSGAAAQADMPARRSVRRSPSPADQSRRRGSS